MQAVTLYTTAYCPYCINAKALLTRKGVTYEEIDVSRSPERMAEMLQRSKRRSVPQIFIGEHHVGGFDDLAALERGGELDALLQA
ncbi:glutaredoxin 3 [Pseudomonas chengduensis]|jgi:glutaredoxin 3|uniref:Glutaredoxin n=2 Tax=Pseudomonadaceae TaxID=135621 RepID=A0A1H2L6B1_9PSED|nr:MULTISPECIES: glutaredoxin 3 [Pseudomonas]KQO28157.1 glutaredoxin [Pseudomonas sp. Leaf83]MBP3063238.1 glutaredoxin 3 [Pseudomonas chengduensis]MDH0960846.1 glutaredoxin 3 [Pseudomonas chengduensis]MDH1537647.1 glutaredoxin 3 [Pseudomonas chengduensis]MDH1558777.1 glutaredoxin 3 [Pseudomonas chengduensis]